ncbi:MAG: hypothetical protein MRERV_1c110 [Mycoplasmataceae bacterium RV_VA103A]|nr:MAG: hypothetical protein MRERV_1c110 [Mycoplasmataceae bacterium RV_VA103A]
MRILKGNKVSEVLIKVSTDCWAKKPHKTANNILKIVPAISFKKILQIS